MSRDQWVDGGATFSADRIYRHHLWRARPADLVPGPIRRLGACLLNPSKAGEDPIKENDHTVRKVIGFGERWGFCRVDLVNISDFCATKPAALYLAGFPVSAECDHYIYITAARVDVMLVAWGSLPNKVARARALRVLEIIAAARKGREVHCIRMGNGGDPMHPLMERYTDAPVLFGVAR